LSNPFQQQAATIEQTTPPSAKLEWMHVDWTKRNAPKQATSGGLMSLQQSASPTCAASGMCALDKIIPQMPIW
jgi:hypothetical protein